jgi:hypothetical protein
VAFLEFRPRHFPLLTALFTHLRKDRFAPPSLPLPSQNFFPKPVNRPKTALYFQFSFAKAHKPKKTIHPPYKHKSPAVLFSRAFFENQTAFLAKHAFQFLQFGLHVLFGGGLAPSFFLAGAAAGWLVFIDRAIRLRGTSTDITVTSPAAAPSPLRWG